VRLEKVSRILQQKAHANRVEYNFTHEKQHPV